MALRMSAEVSGEGDIRRWKKSRGRRAERLTAGLLSAHPR
jgi:hypothetical protein